MQMIKLPHNEKLFRPLRLRDGRTLVTIEQAIIFLNTDLNHLKGTSAFELCEQWLIYSAQNMSRSDRLWATDQLHHLLQSERLLA